MSEPVSKEIQDLLKECVTFFDKEDRAIRERQIRMWRKLKLFWEGFHNTWYSEVAHDWRIWDETIAVDDTQQAYYDQKINVFRAYLESIIAALSVTVPPVKCYPDDADNTLDLSTAKTGDRIAKLLFRYNDLNLEWLHALFIFCTEGMVGCYCYPDSDTTYGTYEKKTYEDTDEEHQYTRCPECGYNLQDETIDPTIKQQMNLQRDKFQPDDSDVPVQDYLQSVPPSEECPACFAMIDPMIVNETLTVTRLVGITQEPKSRICMEMYGGLYIKVPNYARKQADCPYLIYCYETNYVNAIERYADMDSGSLKKSLREKIKNHRGGVYDPYEEWGRLSPQYNGEYPENVVTVRNAWLRPSAFHYLDEEKAKKLKKEFPNGVKVVLVNDEFAEACNESMDDCWTLTYNPMSDYIHFDPLGLLLVSVQEITNDLISLTLQTIEHGIGQTFADPGVLNFDGYRQQEATPGGVYEATPKTGKSVSDAFYQVKTATLSSEVMPFAQNIQSLGQLVSGAIPSLFGGQMQQGGGTASEYSMSRAQALQRLQNVWKMLTSWWKNIHGKAIPMFIKEVKEDERDVERTASGNFVNTFIRRAELEGKIGKIELEANENLPITWSQRKDVIMQLLQTGNPEILAILGAPENIPFIREAIGLDEFFVPGEDDRDKQFDEIKLLLTSTPIMDPELGGEIPSVEIDPDFDNHDIEFEICRFWITSEEGRLAKINNPEGYKNVLLHGKAHLMMLQQAAQAEAQMAMAASGGAPNQSKPKGNSTKDAPITGEADVKTS